jgi:putative nucleotidyltransferase with HDIG domain
MADSSYVRIHTSTLVPDQELGFDVFLKLAGKHIRYSRKDDSIDSEQLKKLKSKKVKYLFIPESEEPAYQSFLSRGLEMLKTKNLPSDAKSELIVGQGKAATEAVFADPEKKENFTRAEEVVSLQVSHLMKSPEALEQMIKVNSFDKTIYQHSVNVSTIAVGLAHFLGAPEEVCQVVGTGGLLHDIGKTKLGLDQVSGSDKLSKEDTEKMRTHPRVGCEVLQGKKYISKDVLDIILLHEERLDGKGYPAGVKKLDQIFQVVGLANLYDKMVTFDGMTPKAAYERISGMSPAPYDPDLIVGLDDVLKKNKIYG